MPKAGVTIERQGPIATVRLARGDRVNALSVAVMEALRDAARELRGDTSVHAIILTGSPVFSAGADLRDPAHTARARAPMLERRELLKLAPDLCAAWEALDQVTVAAIEGFCIGGAVALAVACDFRLMGEGAYLRLPEIPLGWNLNWKAQPRLVNLLGPARAKQLVIFGERLDAATALQWGLADAVAPDGEVEALARVWAEKVAALPPIAVRMAKRGITQQATALNALAAGMDNDQYLLASDTEDHREALRAFRDRRAPVFSGR
jgi:enoyl-CoA hydratase